MPFEPLMVPPLKVSPVVKYVTIPSKHLYSHLVPGERPLWIEGEETLAPIDGDRWRVEIGSNTVQSVTVPLRRAPSDAG